MMQHVQHMQQFLSEEGKVELEALCASGEHEQVHTPCA